MIYHQIDDFPQETDAKADDENRLNPSLVRHSQRFVSVSDETNRSSTRTNYYYQNLFFQQSSIKEICKLRLFSGRALYLARLGK